MNPFFLLPHFVRKGKKWWLCIKIILLPNVTPDMFIREFILGLFYSINIPRENWPYLFEQS